VLARGGVRLVQQTSEARCREGSSWGWDRDSVWVDRGCAGRFSSRSGGAARPGPATGHLAAACETAAVRLLQTRDVRALEPPRRASDDVFEYDMRTPQGPMLCRVERDGKVRAITGQ
jgi:hypothetical protein